MNNTTLISNDSTIIIGIFVVAYFGSVLASTAGIGGSAILTPLYAMISNLQLKDAIILSIITITGNTFIRVIYYGFKKHGEAKNRYLVNYDAIKIIVPFTAITSYLGFYLNSISPNIAIYIILTIIMGLILCGAIIKLVAIIKNKNTKNTIIIILDNIEQEISKSDIERQINNERIGETKLELINNIIYTLLALGLNVFFSFMIKESKIPWIIYSINIIIISLFGYLMIDYIRKVYELRRKIIFNFVEGDLQWNKNKTIIQLCCSSSLIGIISTMFGIGGSSIMNSIMLQLNMLPDVIVATSSVTTFFSSIISSLQYIIIGQYFEWYFGVLFGLGCFGSITSIVLLRFIKEIARIIIVSANCIALLSGIILLSVYNIKIFIENGVS